MNKIYAEKVVTYLISKYDEKKLKNSQYSRTAYARDLDISPSHLSEILKFKKSISTESGNKIVKNLELNQVESKKFHILCLAAYSKDDKVQKEAAFKYNLSSKNPILKAEFIQETESFFQWENLAILELLEIESTIHEPLWISQKIGISVERVEKSINFLVKSAQIVKVDSKWIVNEFKDSEYDNIKNKDAVHNMLLELIEISLPILKKSQVEKREQENTTMTVIAAIDSSRINEARSKMNLFRREFQQEFGDSKNKDALYCMNLNLFRLDRDLD
jgi:uncharacterized protein (TIGR02147 family)